MPTPPEFLGGSNASPDSSVDKESACNAGDPSSIPGSGRSPGERIGYPLQSSIFLPGESSWTEELDGL